MGLMFIAFWTGETSENPRIKGDESFSFTGISNRLYPGKVIKVSAEKETGEMILRSKTLAGFDLK